MSVVYNVTVRNNRLQQVINAIDGGAGNGNLNIQTSGSATIVSITLQKPSATISNGVLTFSGTPIVNPGAPVSGIAAIATVTDSNNNVIISGLTVGTAGTDIVISQTNIAAGDIISFTSGTITGN